MAGKKITGNEIVDGAVDKASDVAGAGVDAAKGALGAVGGLVGGIGKKAKAAAEKAADVVGDVAESAKGAVENVAEKVGDVAEGAIDKAKELAGDAGDLVEGAVGKVGDVAGDVVGGAADAVKGVGGAALGAGAAAIGGVAAMAGGLGKGVKGVAGKVGDVASEGVGLVGETVKGTAGVVGDVAGGAVNVAKGAVGAVGDVANDAVGAVTGKTPGIFGPLLAMVGIGGLIAYGLVNWAGKAPQAPKTEVAAMVSTPAWLSGIGEKLKATFPWLSLGFNGGTIVANGEAADKNAKDAALAEIAAAVEASEGKGATIVDNIKITGSTETPVGAALAKLGANPDAAACGTAFTETMAGRTINFATGKAVINADSQSLLGALTGIASACKAHKIEVAGHTDAKGNPAANKALSQARADAVKAFWTSKSVPAEGLTAVGYGQEKLLDTSGTPEGDAKNRRVEFVVAAAAPAAEAPKEVENPLKH